MVMPPMQVQDTGWLGTPAYQLAINAHIVQRPRDIAHFDTTDDLAENGSALPSGLWCASILYWLSPFGVFKDKHSTVNDKRLKTRI